MGSVGLLVERQAFGGPVPTSTGVVRAFVDEDGGGALGYEAAFAGLHTRAYAAAFKLLGDRSEAEDVAQEALARAYLHWGSVHTYAEPWVVRVASNLAIGSWRKRRRLVHGLEADENEGVAGLETRLPDHLELRAALAALPRRQREVVVLRHLGGFSERETAEALGCSTGTVKQHASRGLAALRQRLGLPDDGPTAGTDGSTGREG